MCGWCYAYGYTTEEIYEGNIKTMYTTQSRANQEIAARSLLQRNPNVITEDFRFIEAMVQNAVGYARVNEMRMQVTNQNPQLTETYFFLYNTYRGHNTMTPENERRGFNALIYTLYRDDKRYSANGGNNAEMAGLQAKQLHIYQNGSKEEREVLFAGLKTVFDGMDKRDKTNVQVVAKALFRNTQELTSVNFRQKKYEEAGVYNFNRELNYSNFLNHMNSKDLVK